MIRVTLPPHLRKLAQVGAELRITRRWTGATDVYPAGRYSELKEWLRAKASDDVKEIVIDK